MRCTDVLMLIGHVTYSGGFDLFEESDMVGWDDN